MTFMQAVEMIDIAANENRLWHYNGGQAYVRLSNDSDVLMVIDHTVAKRVPSVILCDGSEYFKTYEGAQFAYSETRRNDKPLTEYFSKQFADVIELETV